ncbi:MAG: hypothetical protein K2M90_07920 [Treponemataceae bacterium]|nr:hypothetical protein [Treponemataceae bacterium]MDE7392365.1 hypothetical protein [Treponemataceae bacterium]
MDCEVTTIEYGAFNRCDKLETVHYNGMKEEWEKIQGISKSGLADKNIVFAK